MTTTQSKVLKYVDSYVGTVIVHTLSIALAAALLVHFWFYTSIVDRADAWAYQHYALSFREHGLLQNFGTFRTYGYPLFLYVLTYVAGTDPHRLALTTGVVQYLIFLAGTVALSRAVSKFNPFLRNGIAMGLLVNPFMISLVTDNLTEGLSIGAYIWVVAICLMIEKVKSIYAFTALILSGWLISTFSIEIRPANISILTGWCLTMVWIVFTDKQTKGLWNQKALVILSGAALGVAPLLPQIMYNFSNYHSFSPMPVCSLGELQIQYGILAMKYDTVVHGQSAAAYNYQNPLFYGRIETGLAWYVVHPLAGIGTIALHLFNVMSVNNIFTYVRSVNSPLNFFTIVSYDAIYMAGAYYIFIKIGWIYNNILSRRSFHNPVIIFIAVSQFVVLSVCAISAVEVRFGVFACGLLSACAAMLIIELLMKKIQIGSRRFVVLCFTVAVAISLSYFVSSYGSEEPIGQNLNFDFGAHRCVM